MALSSVIRLWRPTRHLLMSVRFSILKSVTGIWIAAAILALPDVLAVLRAKREDIPAVLRARRSKGELAMRKLIITAAIAVAVAIGGTAIAYASIPDSGGVIHGCYTVKGGALRVIDTAKGQTCTTGQHGLNWNQKGLQGPPGPVGVSGYSVALCTVGGDSSGNLVVISSSGGTCSASGSAPGEGFATLTCPAGEKALSSSGRPAPNFLGVPLIWSYLSADTTGYEFALDLETLTTDRENNLEVTCANASWYGSIHSLADQGNCGVAGEPGALVVPAGAGLVAASPVKPVVGVAGRARSG